MIQEVHTDRVLYREPPARFEAGTPNICGAIGLSRALDYLEAIGWDELRAHEGTLMRRAFEEGERRFGSSLKFFGPSASKDREAVLSFSLQGVHPHDVASILDAEGIAIRSGHHCAQPLMERLKVPALSRVSPYLYNTVEEIDAWLSGLEKVAKVFARPPAAG